MFQFKQFTIRQDRTAMKIGTDGVLLGAWTEIEKAKSLLDIGTGTGVIALMAAQRNPEARIDAVEIEKNAFEQAKENISASPWSQRITLFQSSIQNFLPTRHYDCIVCNPPFFNHSTHTPQTERTLARHSDSLSHTELLQHASRLLSPRGKLSVILPVAEAIAFLQNSSLYELYPSRITHVIPTPGKAPKRYLMEFITSPTFCCEKEIVVELSRHQYSAEYTLLTQAFYLHMP